MADNKAKAQEAKARGNTALSAKDFATAIKECEFIATDVEQHGGKRSCREAKLGGEREHRPRVGQPVLLIAIAELTALQADEKYSLFLVNAFISMGMHSRIYRFRLIHERVFASTGGPSEAQ